MSGRNHPFYGKKLSKETTTKLILKEAEKFREKNPEVKEATEKVKKQRKMDLEPKKLDSEAVSDYIKVWGEMGFTPQVVFSIKEVSKKSDFTISELKEFVKTEIKNREKPEEKSEEKTENKKEIKSYDIFEVKEKYFDLIRDKKWNDATELLRDYILNLLKIYTTKDDAKSEMWVYNEGVYIPQGQSEVKIKLRELLGKWYSKWIFGKVIEKIEVDTFIEQDEFFKTNYVNEIPVQNGILNIITKELKPFDKNKIFFNKLPVVYDPSKKCPNIDKHFKEVLKCPEDKKVLYEVIGFILYKEYFLEKMIMFVGNGRNGKGKTIDLIRRFVGVDNCSSVKPLQSLASKDKPPKTASAAISDKL